MNEWINGHQSWVLALRWTARAWSVVSVALVLAFIIGEGFNPSGYSEWLGVLLFPIGISVGMILAWWTSLEQAPVLLLLHIAAIGL